ncbi:chymotrypsin-1-like isoform X1 [Contarinia nasturtii]|uniref:chymotrypsin-1-like isoform X1 n=1 Tax=Contarinia nasturtii TaxID=265458 RepID=UPI0012D40BED|nr:chymotrypsin-1-like isoform X1 [Contarinia nasturtii]
MKLKVIILFCILNSISGGSIPSGSVGYPDFFVVGGTNATDGQAPYQCSMQEYGRHFCGCVIISDHWILTAAHCLNYYFNSILVGTNDVKSGGISFKPLEIIQHEMYHKPGRFDHDIGLIRVDKIEFNEKVQPIKITSNYVEKGAEVQAFGWGRLIADGPSPQYLQTIRLTTISHAECKKDLAGIVDVHDSHLCTFTKKGEGVCHGDSGSALVLGDELVGIANWVKYPCASGGSDGFARVSYLYDWIQSKINQ